MYNPFVPASRTTPPPPAPTEEAIEETVLPAIIGVVCAVLMIFAVVTLVANRYIKIAPCYRGRSLSIPSVEFDVDEILAALEWEKRSGERREQSAELDRNIIEKESDEVIAVSESIPSSRNKAQKSNKVMPEKPRRQTGKSESKIENRRNSRKDVKENPRKKYHRKKMSVVKLDSNINTDNNELNGGQANDNSVPSTSQNITESYVDALDKIRKSNFPKVLPDFPLEHIDYEGNCTHEKRMVNRLPPNLESVTRKITPPSPPSVPVIFTASKDKGRNAVPNFLSLHSNLSSSDKKVAGHCTEESTTAVRKQDKRVPKYKESQLMRKRSDQVVASVESTRKATNPQEEGNVDLKEPEHDIKNVEDKSILLNKETLKKSKLESFSHLSEDVIENAVEEVPLIKDNVEDEFEDVDETGGKKESCENLDQYECSNVSENIASVIKYLAEQEKMEESISISDNIEKRRIENESKETTDISGNITPPSTPSKGTAQSDSDSTKAEVCVEDEGSQRKNMLKDIINEFERKTAPVPTEETANSDVNSQTKPLKLSLKQQQFGKTLEQILQSQISPIQLIKICPHESDTGKAPIKHNAQEVHKERTEDEKDILKVDEENSETINSHGEEELTELSSSRPYSRPEFHDSEENVDSSTQRLSPQDVSPIKSSSNDIYTPKSSLPESISSIEPFCGELVDGVSTSDLNKTQSKYKTRDSAASLAFKTRGIKKSVSEGANKVTNENIPFKKSKSSEYPGVCDIDTKLFTETSDNVNKYCNNEDIKVENNKEFSHKSNNEFNTQIFLNDEATRNAYEVKGKCISDALENDRQHISSLTIASQTSATEEEKTTSPSESISEKCLISTEDELCKRRYSLRELDNNNSSGLIDRPKSDVGKLLTSKQELVTELPQGRKTSSI